MNETLEIPTVDQIIDERLEAKIGAVVNDEVGIAYAQYKERLKQNPTNENGTLMPEAVILNAAGIDVEQLYKQEERDEDGSISFPDLDALHTAFSVIRRDFNDQKEVFAGHNIDIEPVAKAAMQMGDGTERNLEHYYADQHQQYKSEGHENFADMLRGWTAQEKTHSPIFQIVSRSAGIYDEREMTRIQNSLVHGGIAVKTISFPAIGAFTQPQEHLTYASHSNNALLLGKSGQAAIRPVAGQEILHETLFGKNNQHYFTLDQETTDYVMRMFASVWTHFKMPASHSYPGFGRASVLLSNTGLFTHEMTVESFRRAAESLGLLDIEVKDAEAKQAQAAIAQLIDIDSPLNQEILEKMDKLRDSYIKRIQNKGQVPFILGKTVTFEKGSPVFHEDAL